MYSCPLCGTSGPCGRQQNLKTEQPGQVWHEESYLDSHPDTRWTLQEIDPL